MIRLRSLCRDPWVLVSMVLALVAIFLFLFSLPKIFDAPQFRSWLESPVSEMKVSHLLMVLLFFFVIFTSPKRYDR